MRKSKEVWVRVTPNMFNELNIVAEKQGIGYSELIRRLIQELLDKEKDICE